MKLVETNHQPNAGGEQASDPLLPLARLATTRDRYAARQLVEAVAPAMLRAVRRVMGHRTTDVEDVLQESIEGLLDALTTFKGECTVLHFACRIAVLSALASRRRTSFRAQSSADAPDAADATSSLAPSPLERVFANRRRQQLDVLLDELPPAQSEVLVLPCALGFTVEELAATLGRLGVTPVWSWRLGMGAGVERIHYQPRDGAATVEPAPADSFYVPVATLRTGIDARVSQSWTALLRVSADAALATVHFDLHDSDGRTTRVLVPYRVRPGASLGLSYVFDPITRDETLGGA